MLISFKFNYLPYKIEKVFVWINKIYVCVRTNLIIYEIVIDSKLFNIYLLSYNV